MEAVSQESGSAQAQDPRTQQFIDALARLERDNDEETIAGLYAEQSSTGNVQLSEQMQGIEGARKFWHEYRESFGQIESRFSRITEAGDVAVLEWTSSGTLANGQPVEYRGVSVLQFAGEQIADFMAYYDSNALKVELH